MKTPLLLAAAAALILPMAAAPAASSSSIDPQAMAALKRMSETLAQAKSLTYTSVNINELPAVTGQFVTMVSKVDVAMVRPNRLRASITGELPGFRLYYNGSEAAAYAPGTKSYSVQKAPPTIDAMLTGLFKETGVRLVSAPLLYSNPYQILSQNITSAVVVGRIAIGGILCDHLAFRSKDANWEIWIEASSRAVPRRLAVTFTDRPLFPRTFVEFTNWSLNPWPTPGGFDFQPPAGAQQIPFLANWKKSTR